MSESVKKFLISSTPKEPVTDVNNYRWLIHGMPKSGKTSLAAEMPSPIIIKSEEGTKGLSVCSYPDTGPCEDWTSVSAAIKELVTDSKSDQRRFRTVIFDTVEGHYNLLSSKVSSENGVANILKMKYGQGTYECNRRFSIMLNDLERAGYTTILISHTRTETSSIRGIEVNRNIPDLSTSIRRLVVGWVDIIVYTYVKQLRDEEKGEVNYEHVARCVPSEEVEAGGRIRYMPAEVSLAPTPYEGYNRLKVEFNKAIAKHIEELTKEKVQVKEGALT